MNRETLQAMREEAIDVLHLYAALLSAPFFIAKAFVMRPTGAPFRWPPESWSASDKEDSAGH